MKITEAQQHQFNLCHAYGHAMFEIDSPTNSDIGWPTGLKCERCDTLRTIILDLHGNIIQSWYDHTPLYKESLEQGLTRAQARALVMRYERKQKRKAS